MTATATKTSLKKYVRSASNFHALFPPCSIRQIWRFFLELNSNRLYQSSGKEKEGRCLAFTPSTEREIRQFHVVAVQRWQENVQKKRDARVKLLFCFLNLLFFSRSRYRRCCRCLSSLLLAYDRKITRTNTCLTRGGSRRVNWVASHPAFRAAHKKYTEI